MCQSEHKTGNEPIVKQPGGDGNEQHQEYELPREMFMSIKVIYFVDGRYQFSCVTASSALYIVPGIRYLSSSRY